MYFLRIKIKKKKDCAITYWMWYCHYLRRLYMYRSFHSITPHVDMNAKYQFVFTASSPGRSALSVRNSPFCYSSFTSSIFLSLNDMNFTRIFLKCFPRDSNGWFPVSHAKYKREKPRN